MKKTLSIMMLLLAAALPAVAPVSSSIGPVLISPEPGSDADTALRAVRSGYTESWLAEYTADPLLAGEILSPYLSHLLPFSNPVAGQEKDGAVEVLDLDSGAVIAFIFQDGKIKAAYSDIPQLPEF